MNKPFLVHITGNPNIPTLARVNVRSDPGTSGANILFEANIGTMNLPILDCKPDKDNNALNGKVYQWFQAQFPDGTKGWVRDDLVTIDGDGTIFGYPLLTAATYAYTLMRQLLPDTTGTQPDPSPAPTTPTTPEPDPSPAPTEPTTPTTPDPAPAPDPTPAPVPTPTPPTEPTTPIPTPVPAPTTPAEVKGMVISVSGLNMREAPISGRVITRLAYKQLVKILQTRPQGGTSNYIWAQVDGDSGKGWVRTDYLSIVGDGTEFGLSKGDEYQSPLQNYWWVRGQNVNQNPNEATHLGWDFSASAGEPILAGPNGGFVVRLLTCSRCKPDQPNVLSQGIPLDNQSVLLDAGWGFGYGNAAIIRYLNNMLPASTQERLQKRGLGGAHLFVIYAHMSAIAVTEKQPLGKFQQIGVIGNTGNSSATHVHVEVRASLDLNATDWASLRPNELDPEVLFRR